MHRLLHPALGGRSCAISLCGRYGVALALLLVQTALTPSLPAQDEDQSAKLRSEIRQALAAGNTQRAQQAADKLVAEFGDDPDSYYTRAQLYQMVRKHEQAVADLSKVLEHEPTNVQAWEARGSEQFKLGQIEKSVADFNRELKLAPRREPAHWKRGISFYYAKQFDEGIKQFEGYQTVDDSDVENAVWRFLCMAQRDGFKQARAKILKIGDDRRVPMRQIYDLFAGVGTVEDVMTAVQADEPDAATLSHRLFYAHQYLGLYYEAAGDRERMLKHTAEAVERPIGHYMYDVAKVHLQLRKADDAQP